jgi:hypothetical protein
MAYGCEQQSENVMQSPKGNDSVEVLSIVQTGETNDSMPRKSNLCNQRARLGAQLK